LAAATEWGVRVRVVTDNYNRTDAALLELLPGMGPAYSQRIVKYRKRNGRFTAIEQLENIRGIGPKTMDKLRPNVIVE